MRSPRRRTSVVPRSLVLSRYGLKRSAYQPICLRRLIRIRCFSKSGFIKAAVARCIRRRFTDRIAEKPVDRNEGYLDRERIHPRNDSAGDRRAHPRLAGQKPMATTCCTINPSSNRRCWSCRPWISGGIEFNPAATSPPATFLPVDFEIEEHPDGSKTVWCSDHDPMCRRKECTASVCILVAPILN